LPKNIKPATPRGLNGAGTMAGVPSKGKYAFLLQLSQPSTMRAYNGAAKQSKTAASSAAKTQAARIKTQQASVESALPQGSRVLYRTENALAGVAVVTDVRNLSALQRISGVQAVYPIAPKSQSNANAVLFQFDGAPNVWPGSDLGANSSIAIIDTGIDYTHANFGGPGTAAAYNDAKAHDAEAPNPSLFPSAKVVGGTDFAGDTYNADPTADDYQPTPQPDANPLDCGGHGSHVAGSAAGYGENADGTTYTGAYNSSTPFGTMKIGPGMAPQAKLYAYKVFGCDGSTNLVGEAIDRAMDPNDDGNPADHVNVINMSLGSDFGSPQDGDSVAAGLAADAGITVAVASGNGGDYYDVGGSPGNAPKAIAVANSVDAVDVLDTTIVSPAACGSAGCGSERSANYDWGTKADLSGALVPLSQANNDGCDPLSAPDIAAVSGKVGFLEWTDDDTTRRCGSTARADNLAAAGAKGFVFADDQEAFAAGISGNATIPGVLVTKSAGDAIRAALGSGVTITGTSAGSFKQNLPQNDDKVNASSSRGMRGPGNVKPDVTAVGTGVFSTAVGTGTGGVSESGTSMATPMVAGLAALVNSAHPTWTPEQVKADIMNTAGQDLYTGDNHSGTTYAPNRVGAGRIQADAALRNNILAYVQDDPGAVSVSFGPVAVTKAFSATKTVKVVNTGTASASYLLSYKGLTTIPGVNYVVSPSSLTVAAGQTKTFTVTLSVPDPTKLTKSIDQTMDRAQGAYPREFLADASGRVVLQPTTGTTGPQLRVPVYSAPRPASSLDVPTAFNLPTGGLQKGNLPISGTGVNQGAGNQQVISTAAGFELQLTSPKAPVCSVSVTTGCVHLADERSADLRYVGITSDAPQVRSLGNDPLSSDRPGFVYFAVSTQGAWRTPAATQEFDIYIDTNSDNVPDAVLFNTRLNGTDVFVDELIDLHTGDLLDVEMIDEYRGVGPTQPQTQIQDMALYDSDTLVMPVALPSLFPQGTPASQSRIRYGIASYSNESAGPIDILGIDPATGNLSDPRTFNTLTPGLVVYGSYNAGTSFIRVSDQPKTSVVVRRDTTTYFTDHALGALIVHFHNGVGRKAQVVTLKSKPTVNFSLSPTSIKLNSTSTASVQVVGYGINATGKVDIRHVGGGIFATGTLSGGRLTIKIKPGSRARFTVRAEYRGDTNYAANVSKNIILTVT
jgi:subtilisin family serine protease